MPGQPISTGQPLPGAGSETSRWEEPIIHFGAGPTTLKHALGNA